MFRNDEIGGCLRPRPFWGDRLDFQFSVSKKAELARSGRDLVSIWGDVGGDSRGWGKEGEQTAGDRQPWVGGNPSPGGETNHPCHELVMRLQWKPHACTSPPVIGLASAINEIYNFHHMQGLKGICPMQIA